MAARVSIRLVRLPRTASSAQRSRRLSSTRTAVSVLLAHAEVTKSITGFQWVQNVGSLWFKQRLYAIPDRPQLAQCPRRCQWSGHTQDAQQESEWYAQEAALRCYDKLSLRFEWRKILPSPSPRASPAAKPGEAVETMLQPTIHAHNKHK